jgi:hypothetical protein
MNWKLFVCNSTLGSAWARASEYAGPEGHIATLPDIIQARLNKEVTDISWMGCITTSSFEAVGRSKAGHLIIIVGHDLKPLSTLEAITEAYSYEFQNPDQKHRGGRISIDTFHSLESGKYGEVSIVSLNKYMRDFKNPFHEPLTSTMAWDDPLTSARLFNPNFFKYIEKHGNMAIKYAFDYYGLRLDWPYIFEMYGSINCPYENYESIATDGLPFFHLLSISGLKPTAYASCHKASLVSRVSPFEWNSPANVLGIPKE